MTSPIADGVMAATYKLVQQAMSGQWHDVPKTIEERRVLLDSLASSASPQDHQWLGALRQAMAESDAVVAKMTSAGATGQPMLSSGAQAAAPAAGQTSTAQPADSASFIDSTMDMLRNRK
jgi:hypothetical protein